MKAFKHSQISVQ